MVNIDCKGCSAGCCKAKEPIVLFPFEQEDFKVHSHEVQTPFGNVYAIQKNEDNHCIALEGFSKCMFYPLIPFRCKLYPLEVYFKNDSNGRDTANVRVDRKYCPHAHLNNLIFNGPEIIKKVRSYEYPQEWIDAYEFLRETTK